MNCRRLPCGMKPLPTRDALAYVEATGSPRRNGGITGDSASVLWCASRRRDRRTVIGFGPLVAKSAEPSIGQREPAAGRPIIFPSHTEAAWVELNGDESIEMVQK